MQMNDDSLIKRHTGVATVWLLSTLGTRSAHRRITKREIQQVSIPQTCGAIKQPTVQLPLRVSSSLLYGVALAYKQKTEYLSCDASALRARVHRDVVHRDAQLGVDVLIHPVKQQQRGKHALLVDDPSFSIDTGLLPPPLDFFDSDGNGNGNHTHTHKHGIMMYDLENGALSLPRDDELTLQIGGLSQGEDILQGDNVPEFAFGDDGFLLEMDGTTMTAGGDMVFNDDIDFGETGVDQSRNEAMHQILEEVDENDHRTIATTQATHPDPPTKRRRLKKIVDQTSVVFDTVIGITTDELRSFRDGYLALMVSKTKRPKTSVDISSLLTSKYLPSFATVIPQVEYTRGRPTDGDFIDGLIRARRESSVSSIESGRNASLSRRHSRGSISGLNIPLQGDNEMLFTDDIDFGDFELEDVTSGSSKRRSSSILGTRLPGVNEEALDFDIDGHQHHAAAQHDTDDGSKTVKFFKFLESRFQDDAVDIMSFAHFLDHQHDLHIVVKAFYELLQLKTLGEIGLSSKVDDPFGLLTADDIFISTV